MKYSVCIIHVLFILLSVSCEVLDDDIGKHTDKTDSIYVELSEVAEILSSLPLDKSHMSEVYDAVTSSSGNGYDEEYTMKDLFESPGRGVGDVHTRSEIHYDVPLRDLISSHVHGMSGTKSGGSRYEADEFLDALTCSDIQNPLHSVCAWGRCVLFP